MADLGQVFTKSIVAKYMVSMFDLPAYARIMEPCIGDGAFIKALNNKKFVNVVGCEIDKRYVEKCNMEYPNFHIFEKDFLQYFDSEKFDGIIMNPPYIRQEKINDLAEYGITKNRLQKQKIFNNLPSTANIYMYFIVKAIDLLKENGQLVVIFPSSWMNTKSGQGFKHNMLKDCALVKQVHIYGDVFEKQALVDVVIMKLVKSKEPYKTKEEYLEVIDGKIEKSSICKIDDMNMFDASFDSVASVQRGMSTGCNSMFINPDIHIEDNKQYLKPIISSPKSIDGYSTDNAHKDFLLWCNDDIFSKEVNKYLDQWRKIILENKSPKTLYQDIKQNKKWYGVREVPSRGIIFSYFVRNDMKFVMNDTDCLVRDNFYIIRPKIDLYLMFALLNNYYTYLQLEVIGKKYGAGLLKLQKYDLEQLKFPCYYDISENDKMSLINESKSIISNNNTEGIKTITEILSKYSDVSFDDILDNYENIKNNRLRSNINGNKCC